jgi:16S rRNA (guanine527-N7)-methyltransferase
MKASTPKKGSSHRRSSETFSFNEADDRIYDIFRNHGFADYPHEKRQKLTRFYQLLMENQKNQNFTRLLTLKDTAIKHFIDCLMVTRLTQLSYPLLDLGTGPGFPGIPLKIDQPQKRFILTEGVQKRVEFLKMVREDLQLKDLDIIGRNVGHDFLYPVQGVITRAVEDARNTLGNVLNCLQTGGRVFLMKGPNCEPEIEMALEAWGEYYALERKIEYELPHSSHERRLLIFRKTKKAPEVDLDALNDKEEWSD